MAASKMAQRVRALAAKSDCPSSVPRPTLWKESTSKLSLTTRACKLSYLLATTHVPWHAHASLPINKCSERDSNTGQA